VANAKQGDTVRVHYRGTLQDGSEFDSSKGRDPLEFTIGSHMVIAGFENGIIGMATGDKKTVDIPCIDAYGPLHAEMIQEVARDQIPASIPLSLGGRLQATAPDGRPFTLTITAMSDESVTLDANHPLAGKDLTFELELVEIA
jgi:FKBP-type peptidyl-prolyl cis-trans isomerase 2